jgi:redox-sensitive bicupin YhaK (pirin superfamily)
MAEKGELLFREQHQKMIALADAIKEQAEFLAYSVNPIGMPYEQWRMMVQNSQSEIAEIESLLPQLKDALTACLEA